MKFSKKQQDKLDSLEFTWQRILDNAKKHILEGDERVLTLPDIQLILGTATLMFEEEIYKEIQENGTAVGKVTPDQLKELAKAYEEKSSTPGLEKREVVSGDTSRAEAEFDKDNTVNKTRVYH